MKRPDVLAKGSILVVLLFAFAPSVTAQRAPLRGLDAYVGQAVRDWEIAGLAIAVVQGDSVVFAKGYGVREVGKPEPVDPNTLFAIGSNTKLFTAVAAGMMVDEGKMQWDDPATKHLPSFQLHDAYVTREMTLRDLLSHRSGLGRRGDLLWYGTEYDRGEVLRRVRSLAPNTSFRSAYGYQNIMFLAAGEAVAAAAGRSWDEVIRERIFQPLGMARSNTSVRELQGDGNVARPHVRTDGKLIPVPYRNIDNIAPAGSINSSAREMAEWVKMLLADGSYRDRKLLEPATLREITTPHTIIRMPPDTLFPSVHFVTYGLGVVAQDYRGVKMLWHTGGIDGMLSLVGLIPEKKLGVVVLTNTSGHNNLFTALMYRVFDAYLGAPQRDWSRILLAQTEAAEAQGAEQRRRMEEARVKDTQPSLPLDGYTGRYESAIYGDITVARENEGLVLRFGPSFVADLEHWHYDTFRPRWREATSGGPIPFVTFTLDAAGKVERLKIEDLDDFRRAPEQPTTTARQP